MSGTLKKNAANSKAQPLNWRVKYWPNSSPAYKKRDTINGMIQQVVRAKDLGPGNKLFDLRQIYSSE